MALEYVNRKEERYFLYEGRTKAGNPKYYCSRKPSASGVTVEAMPPGYEWYESPADGIVSVRKVRPSQITPTEREILAEAIRILAGIKTFIIDTDGDTLVIHLPDRDPEEFDRIFGLLTGGAGGGSMRTWAANHCRYTATMRFVLEKNSERLFSVDRWCFRGSIDGWIHLERAAPLATQIKKYVPHLGKESIYELF